MRPADGLRVAFVVPRYGVGVVGGAEMLCRLMAENLVAHGMDAQVLTTCAVDHFVWADHHPEGTTVENGVPVHRFRLNPDRDNGRFFELHAQIDRRVPTGRAEQLEWMAQSAWSPGLQAAAEDAGRFDWLVGMPYLFGTTFWAVAARPERTALIPCVHDEAHAWLPVVREMLGRRPRLHAQLGRRGRAPVAPRAGRRGPAGERGVRRRAPADRRAGKALLRGTGDRPRLPALRRAAGRGQGRPGAVRRLRRVRGAGARTRRGSR